jgi:hypothetical protein
MGANAQTSVPAFTAGQVLTAAEMTEVNTGIPVFADTTARDAAFGGAGEKVLAQGQYAYIEATSSLQVYTGAAWIAAGQTPGLVCVKAETAVTASASATADNVFTSSYTNYLLLINYTTTTGAYLDFRLRVGGVSASTNYNNQTLEINGTLETGARNTAQTSTAAGVTTTGDFKSSSKMELFTPQLAQPTNYIISNSANYTSYATPYSWYVTGNHTTATAYDGIEFLVGSGTWSGSYAIYGYSKVV